MKIKIPTRILTGAMATVMSLSIGFSSVLPACAAAAAEATIHKDHSCSLTLYKYDFTNARKDGVWDVGSYTSTGIYDETVNNIWGNAVRKGASGSSSALGNGETSSGYSIKGVEYTYKKVADIYQHTGSGSDDKSAGTEVLYAFSKETSQNLLNAIGLTDGAESNLEVGTLPGNEGSWYYRSDVLNKALSSALSKNSTTVKNALERFAADGTAMPLTDSNGYSKAENMEVGLYLLIETKVPEMVTDTTAPFFISLPMTSVNGGGLGTEVTDGGHRWIYDVTVYPKNETGILTLEKTLRESKEDGGKHNGTDSITDGYSHSTTASTGDVIDYQIISTLPTITSRATSISTYNFFDTIVKGLRYNKDVKIAIFTDKACTDPVTTWEQEDGKFTVSYSEDGKSMTVDITEAGLAEINGDTTNTNGSLYAGYSNYTIRVSYTAVLTEDALTAAGDQGNDNKVVLTWKRTSNEYYDTLIDDCHVHTFGLNLEKQFSDMDAQGAEKLDLFKDVKFKLYNETDKKWLTVQFNEANGIYYVSGYADSEKEASILSPVTVSGKPGQLVIKGLEDDDYLLTEIETADGYTLLKDDIKVSIQVSENPAHSCDIYSKDTLGLLQNDPRYAFSGGLDLHLQNIPQKALSHSLLTGTAAIDGYETTMAPDGNSAHAFATLTVVNSRGFDLPKTGDNGAKILPIAGAVIAGASGMICCVYIFLKRRSSAD